MDEMRNFKLGMSGGILDMDGFPDMPEDVRAYLIELRRQLKENGAEGVTAVAAENIPPEVNEYFARVIRERVERGQKDPDSVTVAEFPVERFSKIQSRHTVEMRRRLEKKYAKTYEMRLFMRRIEIVLRSAFLLVVSKDSDWRALGVKTADMLWQGVTNAVLYAAARSDEQEFKDIEELYNKSEDDGDEA